MYSIELEQYAGTFPHLLGETDDLQQARACMMGAFYALEAVGTPGPYRVEITGDVDEFRGRSDDGTLVWHTEQEV